MTPQEFCYWLQGFFEITGDAPAITAEQSKMIREHLQLVFEKRTGSSPTVREAITESLSRQGLRTINYC